MSVGVLDMALWDIVGKLEGKPLFRVFAERFNEGRFDKEIFVYAAGGYYYPGKGVEELKSEMRRYQEYGYSNLKMKIAGESLSADLARIEAVLSLVESGQKLSVDANGRYSLQEAIACAEALHKYDLFWYEEAGDPLDYAL